MILSQTAEYALRAMAWLALHEDEGPIKAVDLNAKTGIPQAYLSKILRRMVLSGLLHAQKGHGGGFVLAKGKGEIRFLDILAAVDSIPAQGQCRFGWGTCDALHPCPLHEPWGKIGAAVQAWLVGTTLLDVREVGEIREPVPPTRNR